MKCFQCKNHIDDEINMILLNGDGDFVCSKKCQEEFYKERDEFFANIHDDEWYENYMNL